MARATGASHKRCGPSKLHPASNLLNAMATVSEQLQIQA